MKPLRLLLIGLLLFMPVVSHAADVTKQRTFEFRMAFREATEAFQRHDYDLAERKVEEADKLAPDASAVWNLKGAIAVERGQYDEATRCLKRALEINPRSYPARYNLTEIPFRQKKYAEARAKLETLLAKNPKDELVQYKIFLSYLFEKDEKNAKEALDRIKFPSDSPAYYYAQAAWASFKGDNDAANKWIRSSAYVFKPAQNELFAASLREVGWLAPQKP